MGRPGSAKWVALAFAAAAVARVEPHAEGAVPGKSAIPAQRHVDSAPAAPESPSPAKTPPSAPALAGAAPIQASPPLALVVGEPLGHSSSILAFDANGARRWIGTFAHAPGAALRAATLSDNRVAIVNDVTSDRD